MTYQGKLLLSAEPNSDQSQGISPPETDCESDCLECLDLLGETCINYCLDAEGIFTYVNDAVSLLGYTPDELVGQHVSKFFDLEHPARATLDEFAGVTPTDGPISRRLSVARRADGEVAFMEIREGEVRDSNGMLQSREGIAYDLTHYVTANLTLHQSERKYRRLVEDLGEDYAIYTHKPNGELTYISPSVQAVLGFPAETLIGRNWRELIGENFVGREVADQVKFDIKAGIRFHKFTVEVADAYGGRRLVEIQQRPVFSPDGRYVSMEGIAKDITEFTRNAVELQKLKDELEERVAERTAELVAINDRLVESESRYRNVVEDQTEFICRWLPGGRYTFVNEAYCRYMKKPYGELIGHSFLPNVIEEDRDRVANEIANLTPANPTFTTEHRVRRPDGSIGWNQWTNRAIFDEFGNSKGYQSVGRDITELKAAEDKVLEREGHLMRVSRLAIMGELIAGIAHEIHQPLHAAQLFAEAARRNLESETAGGISTAIDCTREISNAVNRTATIIRHLRSFSTTKPTKIEPLEMNQVVHEVVDVLSYETRRAGVKLLFELDENLPAWNGDRVQIHQVIVHLLRNAYEAMPTEEPGNCQVTIRTSRNADCLLVEIIDNGPGTELADVERLFDPFYTTKREGLGMGLSICKTIAESLNAEVEARKNPDRGLTFTLKLHLTARY
jgi:PAS domain S-box-containing protein